MSDFITDHYRMTSGQGNAVSRKYHLHIGKSGNTWLISDQPNSADNIYVTNSPANNGTEGFGGAKLKMPLVDGGEFLLIGGWHSNSGAFFADTGIDIQDKHETFVVLSKGREYLGDGSLRTKLTDVVYQDETPQIGRFSRYKELIKLYLEANFYYSQSSGGSCSGHITDKDRDN